HNPVLHSFPTRRSSDLRELNWKLIDKCLIFDIAKMANVDVDAVKKLDEHPDPLLTRISRLFWGGGAERGMVNPDHFDCKKMTERSEEHTSELQSRFDLV